MGRDGDGLLAFINLWVSQAFYEENLQFFSKEKLGYVLTRNSQERVSYYQEHNISKFLRRW